MRIDETDHFLSYTVLKDFANRIVFLLCYDFRMRGFNFEVLHLAGHVELSLSG